MSTTTTAPAGCGSVPSGTISTVDSSSLFSRAASPWLRCRTATPRVPSWRKSSLSKSLSWPETPRWESPLTGGGTGCWLSTLTWCETGMARSRHTIGLRGGGCFSPSSVAQVRLPLSDWTVLDVYCLLQSFGVVSVFQNWSSMAFSFWFCKDRITLHTNPKEKSPWRSKLSLHVTDSIIFFYKFKVLRRLQYFSTIDVWLRF